MSRAYRIRQAVRVQDSLKKDLSASDEICTELEILEILPPESMGELLEDALRKRGFAEEDGAMVRRDGDITVRIDPTSAELTIRVEGAESVELQGTKETNVWLDLGEEHKENVREGLRQAIRKELQQRADTKAEDLQREVSAELEAKLGDLSAKLDQVVNEVTREALKKKAASLGQIKEMAEDPEAGSLTITVEV
jgi:hypothetical protein